MIVLDIISDEVHQSHCLYHFVFTNIIAFTVCNIQQ